MRMNDNDEVAAAAKVVIEDGEVAEIENEESSDSVTEDLPEAQETQEAQETEDIEETQEADETEDVKE